MNSKPEDSIREMESRIEELESQLSDQDQRLHTVEYELRRLQNTRQLPPERRGFFN
jgi:uncharacterized coiled-coil protein SlyX